MAGCSNPALDENLIDHESSKAAKTQKLSGNRHGDLTKTRRPNLVFVMWA